MLQWGRDQLVAEMHRAGLCFVTDREDSMGPRPIGRGNVLAAVARRGGWLCFNGAATNWSPKSLSHPPQIAPRSLLQWGRDQLVAEIPCGGRCRVKIPQRFNGAATNWSRKWFRRRIFSMHPTTLQWGRDQLVAEIRSSAFSGAWQWSFNGAATNWSRKSAAAHSAERGSGASMGPRPIGRGNKKPCCWPRRAEMMLQWGRDQLVAEITNASIF